MNAKMFIGNQRIKAISRCCHTVHLASKYDMVIVGGGMVGFGLLALAGNSKLLGTKRILLLDSESQKGYSIKHEYENRVVALNHQTQSMLKTVGAWDIIASNRYQVVKKMRIWETESNSFLTFDKSSLASIVENNLVVHSLLQSVNNNKELRANEVTIVTPSTAENIQIPATDCLVGGELVQLDVRQNSSVQKVTTNLLIGADGSQSIVRAAANLPIMGWDHDQKAIVATLKMGENHEEFTAWQRFLPTGPIALLPLSNEYSSLVWSTSSSECERLMKLDDAEFIHELNYQLNRPSQSTPSIASLLSSVGQSVFSLLDKCTSNQIVPSVSSSSWSVPVVDCLQPNTRRNCFKLRFQHATNYATSRVALVGDAAHRVLPLAGQGVNLGFGDVISLVRHLESAISHGADIGNEIYLQNYTTERQRFVVPLAAVIELLNMLYSSQIPSSFFSKFRKSNQYLDERITDYGLLNRLLVNVRSTGMNMVEGNQLIKSILMNAAITGQFGPTCQE